MRIYIRWKRTGLLYGWEAEIPRKEVTFARFPDREILIVWEPKDYPKMSEWDEVVDLSPYEDDTVGRKMLNSVLVSAHNVNDKASLRDMERARPGIQIQDMITWNKSGLEVIGDSGGAQLYTGKTTYIPPEDVIRYFNKGAHIGMALDIPPREVDQASNKIVHACALAQAHNNDVFEQLRGPDVKLFNVIHGFDIAQARNFLKVVSGDGKFNHWDGWGIGSGNWMELSLLRNCILTLKEAPWPEKSYATKADATTNASWLKTRKVRTGSGDVRYKRAYQHLHLFAMSGAHRIPAFAWLGRYIDRFTVDSTQWMQGIRYNRYLTLLPSGELITFPMGRERNKQEYINRKVAPVIGAPLPCSCPVCRCIPTWDIFTLPSRYRLYTLLGWHNIWITLRMTEMWAANAATMSEEQYRDEAAYATNSGAHFIIDFIEQCIHGDMDAALEQHKMLFVYEKQGNGGQIHSILPGKKGEKADDPLSQIGATNIFMNGESFPSLLKTTLPNYLAPEEILELGLTCYPPTKGRKRMLERKKARKRYKYRSLGKVDYRRAVEQYCTSWEADGAGTDASSDLRDDLAKLKDNKSRRLFCVQHGVALPKRERIGEVVLVTDAEMEAKNILKHKRQGSRYKRKRLKRSVKKGGRK